MKAKEDRGEWLDGGDEVIETGRSEQKERGKLKESGSLGKRVKSRDSS